MWFAGLNQLISNGRHRRLTRSQSSYVSFNMSSLNDYLYDEMQIFYDVSIYMMNLGKDNDIDLLLNSVITIY